MQTALDLVRRAALRSPDAVAMVDVGEQKQVSYAALLRSIEAKAAGFLNHAMRSGDRIAVVLPNSLDAGIAILALHRAGAVPALLNPRLKPAEIVALIRQGEMAGCVLNEPGALCETIRAEFGPDFPVVVLTGTGGAGTASFASLERDATAALPPHRPNREDPAFIFYTSGTTGLPKGVVIPQRAAEARVLFMATQCGHTFGAHNRIAGLMPLCHVIGFYAVLLMSLAFNGTFYLIRDFVPAEVLKVIDRHRLTGLFVTPTHLDALTRAYTPQHDLSSLEVVTFAGALMPDRVLMRVREVFSCRLVNIYGTTEAMNSLFMPDPATGAQFLAGYYSEARVVRVDGSPADAVAHGDDGELVVALNDATFLEYLGRPDVTREKLVDGWYRTSDAAVVREDGRIEIKGRVDDTIISGGENIHPQEVEDVLLACPGVKDVAVIGVPDDRWGQKVVACVVVSTNVDSNELDRYCRASTLADFKRPRSYHLLDALPRNATNKVLRKALVQQIQTLEAGTDTRRAEVSDI